MKDRLNQYHQNRKTPAPLSRMVEKTIQKDRKNRWHRTLKRTGIGLVASFSLIILMTAHPAMAKSLQGIPLVGEAFKVISIANIYDDGSYNSTIETPVIVIESPSETTPVQEPSSQEAQVVEIVEELNSRYKEESQALYEAFMAEVEEIEANGGGHLGVDSGYDILTDDDRFFAVSRYVVNTVASSSTVKSFDTIDKENGWLLTLPSLFKDDAYLDVISQWLKDEMVRQMAEDDQVIYWVEGVNPSFVFEGIEANQDFYINKDHQLVIAFDKYLVGPGYMGLREFPLPYKLLEPHLVNPDYLNKDL